MNEWRNFEDDKEQGTDVITTKTGTRLENQLLHDSAIVSCCMTQHFQQEDDFKTMTCRISKGRRHLDHMLDDLNFLIGWNSLQVLEGQQLYRRNRNFYQIYLIFTQNFRNFINFVILCPSFLSILPWRNLIILVILGPNFIEISSFLSFSAQTL